MISTNTAVRSAATATATGTGTNVSSTGSNDGYAGSVSTPLQAGDIYGSNPSIAAAAVNKEADALTIAAGVFIGLVAFAVCCGNSK